jgi:hypothetical protein
MAKLALGVGFSVFGDEYLSTTYAKELQKGMWFRGTTAGEMPQVRGESALGAAPNPRLQQLTGLPDAVTVTLFPTPDALVVILDIGRQLSWRVTACLRNELPHSQRWSWLDSGQTIVMYKYLQAAVTLPFPEFLGHLGGEHSHKGLSALSQRLRPGQLRSP